MPQTSERRGAADARTTPQIERTAFSIVPLALAEECASQKGTLFVYIWLWHYAGRDDAAWPSVDRLALECRMKTADVRKALGWLAAAGWITRIDRAGKTTIYRVRTEHPSPKRGRPRKGHPSPKKGRAPLPQMGDPTPPPNGVGHPSPKRGSTTPPPFGGDEQEALNKNPEQEPKETPHTLPTVGCAHPLAPDESEAAAEALPNSLQPAALPEQHPAPSVPRTDPLAAKPRGNADLSAGPGGTLPPAAASKTSPARARRARSKPPAAAEGVDSQEAPEAPSRAAEAPVPKKAPLPEFLEPVRDLLVAWWRVRKAKHRVPAGEPLTTRSLAALELAHQQGVLREFVELGAEAGWMSFGFSREGYSYRERIAELVAEKSGAPNDLAFHPGSSTMRRSGQRGGFSGALSRQAEAADRVIAMFDYMDQQQCSTEDTSFMPLLDYPRTFNGPKPLQSAV